MQYIFQLCRNRPGSNPKLIREFVVDLAPFEIAERAKVMLNRSDPAATPHDLLIVRQLPEDEEVFRLAKRISRSRQSSRASAPLRLSKKPLTEALRLRHSELTQLSLFGAVVKPSSPLRVHLPMNPCEQPNKSLFIFRNSHGPPTIH